MTSNNQPANNTAQKPRKRRNKNPMSLKEQEQLKRITQPAAKGNTYASGHGRPTVYKPEYAQMMIDHFKKAMPHCLEKGEDAQGNTKIVAADFVTFEDFADSIGVSVQSLYNWYKAIEADGSHKYSEFVVAYECCKTIQSALVLRGGMTGAYKGGFATLAAMNIMGWKTQAESQTEHIVAAGMAETIVQLTQQNRRKAQSMMENMQRERESD